MPIQFQQISLKDLSRGIDNRSTDNAIEPGFASDLLNMDTNSQGFLHKRKGYQGYYGYLPLRIKEISQVGTDITLKFDDAVSVIGSSSTPLVIYGRSTATSDFSDTPGGQYYTDFSVEARRTLSGDGTESYSHTNPTTQLLTGIVESTDSAATDNSAFIPDKVQIDEGTYVVDYDYSLGVAPDIESFIFVADKRTSSGSSYGTSFVAGDWSGTGPYTMTFAAATHNLDNINPIIQLYEDIGAEQELVIPDEIEIDDSTGSITITVDSDAKFAGQVVMSDVPTARTQEQAVTQGSTVTVDVTPPSGYVFFTSCYLIDTVNDLRYLVIPDSVVYTESTNQLRFSVVAPADGNLQVCYEAGEVIANTIKVTANDGSESTSDLSPQITLWGMNPNNITYTAASTYGGHVHHLDSYRRELESRVIAGVGGNLFEGKSYSEISSAYKLGAAFYNLRDRVDADTHTGPVFYTTGASPNVTRAITADDVEDNYAVVSAVNYVSTGVVDFTLTLTTKVGDVDLITSSDKLTVTGMAHARFNGTHTIVSADDSTNKIRCNITGIDGDDWDELAANGRAGVFTQPVVIQGGSTDFVADDILTADAFTTVSLNPVVYDVSGGTIYISGLTSEATLNTGNQLRGTRTNTVLPLEDVDNFVVGDMCTITGFEREMRVLSIDTTNKTLTMDESLTISDSTDAQVTVAVSGRWVPVESPTTDDTLPKSTYYRHFDSETYGAQSVGRSAMASDNLYITNYQDEVLKFDGTNIYRAGIPRWQPQLFVQLDDTTGSIARGAKVAKEVAAASGDEFTVDNHIGISANDKLVHDEDNAVYTVAAVSTTTASGTDTHKIRTTVDITGTAGSGNLRRLRQLQYYFRLYAVDANDNIVACATTGLNDYIVNLTVDGQVKIRLIGMPTWGAYDYDTLRLQIFRADLDIQEFFRVGQLDIPFNNYDGYIDFTDSNDGAEALVAADELSTILEGGEIGNVWEQPLRAKYCTTANNSLVLGNIKDYPEIGIELRQETGASITTANLDGVTLFLKKDLNDALTATNMVDRVTYEFTDGTATSELTVTTPATDIVRDASTFSITTATNHGLSVGDWIYCFHAAEGLKNDLQFAGWWQVSVIDDADTFTVNATNSFTPSDNDIDRVAVASSSANIPVWLGTDGNYNTTTGNSSLSYERLAMIRLSNAINASMRVADLAVTGQSEFTPWISARAGDEIGLGRLILRQPTIESTTFTATISAAVDNGTWLVDAANYTAGTETPASTRIFRSRIIVSYPNFAEIFNGPFGLDVDSSFVYDLSPADGQQITAILTFFGRALFGASQQEDMLVVFKENSIHIVNLSTRETKRLETHGVGCSVPYSAAYTQDGIMFAHNSGIWKLNKQLEIEYVGKYIERLWEDYIQEQTLSRATGHHYAVGRQYKLSVPLSSASQATNNAVLVYDYARESDRVVEFGAWSRYDNHNATGWVNLEDDAFFSTINMQVMKVRRAGDATDFRDDASAISSEVTYAPMDFGLPGSRKIIRNVIAHYQLRFSGMVGTEVSSSIDFDNTFRALDEFELTRTTPGAGVTIPQVKSVRYHLPRKRMEFLILKFENSTIDEDLRISGLDASVGVSSPKSIPTAKETTT